MADADTGGTGEEIELRELEEAEAEDREDDEGDSETNLDEDDENLEWDDSIVVPSGSQGFSPDPYLGPQGDIPNVLRGLKRTITQDKKIFLKNALSVSLNKGDGTNSNSRTIFENLQLTNDLRSGKNNGAKYNRVKIIVVKDGRYEYSSSSDKKTTRAIAEFRATLEKAKAAIGDVEKQLEDFGVEDVSQEDAVSILSSIGERLSNRLAELEDDVLEVRRGGLTKAEVDEIIGVLAFDRTGNMSPEDQIKTLTEVEIPFWKEKLNESEEQSQGSVRSKQITGIIEMLEIKSDVLSIRNNQKPETDLVKKLIKEEVETGDISRFKRFSKWAKENTFGFSAV